MSTQFPGYLPPTFDLRAATLLVVANMIGTGVFTTLGLQAQGVPGQSHQSLTIYF